MNERMNTKMGASIKIFISGIEELERLVKEHRELADKLQDNISEIRSLYLRIETEMNQPPAATEG